MRLKLSDYGIARLKPPATGRLEVHDLICPGLVMRITMRDVRSWSVAYKVRGEGGYSETGRPLVGVQHRITLGRYPQVGLAAARMKARKLLEVVSEGRDPRPARREAHQERRSNTVAAVAKRFIAQECNGHIKSWRRIERTLELHVLPVLGNRPIADIERADIHKLVDDLVAKDRVPKPLPGAAREVIKHVHRLFDFAFDRGIIKANPAHQLKRKALKANGEAGRALDDEELKAIWHAAVKLGYPFGDWIRLLMLTGARRNEWAEATRSEIDFEARTHNIPSSRYKTGRDHTVPLVGPAWEIFDTLPIWNEGDFLFSTTGGLKAINSAAAAKKKIDKLAPTDRPWRIHDFRVTCETRMAALGIKPDHFESVLGHVKKGMEAIYNKHSYEAEKRAALELYARHLMEIVK